MQINTRAINIEIMFHSIKVHSHRYLLLTSNDTVKERSRLLIPWIRFHVSGIEQMQNRATILAIQVTGDTGVHRLRPINASPYGRFTSLSESRSAARHIRRRARLHSYRGRPQSHRDCTASPRSSHAISVDDNGGNGTPKGSRAFECSVQAETRRGGSVERCREKVTSHCQVSSG